MQTMVQLLCALLSAMCYSPFVYSETFIMLVDSVKSELLKICMFQHVHATCVL